MLVEGLSVLSSCFDSFVLSPNSPSGQAEEHFNKESGGESLVMAMTKNVMMTVNDNPDDDDDNYDDRQTMMMMMIMIMIMTMIQGTNDTLHSHCGITSDRLS